MTTSGQPRPAFPDEAEMARKWAAVAEQSQRVVQAFTERQVEGGDFSLVDLQSVSRAFLDLMTKMAADPVKLAEAQLRFWQDSVGLWQAMSRRMLGQEAAMVAEPEKGDRRFKDKAWNEELAFDYIKQSYLLTSRWVQSTVGGVEGLDPLNKKKVDFFTRQFLSAMSPTNFALTNPAVLKKTRDSGGENLLDGLEKAAG